MKKEHIGDLIFSQTQILEGVKTVASKLNEKFNNDRVVVITVVPGGIIFTADLVLCKLSFNSFLI